MVEGAFGGTIEADLVDALRRSPGWLGFSFVAEASGAVVGHIAVTRSLLDAPRRLVDVLVLAPVSVAPAHQGRGIGSALMRHGIEQARRRPEPRSSWRATRRSIGASGSSRPSLWDSGDPRCASRRRPSR
jgi:putative acetyltransferase